NAHREQGSKAAAPFFITAQSPCPTAEAATLDRHRARALPPQTLIGVSLSPFFYAAGRNITPSGISPVVAMRQSAMSSKRLSEEARVAPKQAFGASTSEPGSRATATTLRS